MKLSGYFYIIALINEVTIVEPSRLMTLLGDCIKWQQQQGLLPVNEPFDLFRDSDKVQAIEQDAFVNYGYANIKVSSMKCFYI